MRQIDHHIVGGSAGSVRFGDVLDPNNGGVQARVALGDRAVLDRAVAAAKAAFASFSLTSKAERLALLKRILEAYNERYEDIAQAVSYENGSPITWATSGRCATTLPSPSCTQAAAGCASTCCARRRPASATAS